MSSHHPELIITLALMVNLSCWSSALACNRQVSGPRGLESSRTPI